MRRTWIMPVLAALALTACGAPAPSQPETPGVENQATGLAAEPAGTLPQALPGPDAAPRFVGMWAVDQRLCADPAWRFEANSVSTQGEVHCDFNRIVPAPAGYSVAATCYAEGPATPMQMELSFAESARAMMITGGPWAHANLVYCGPLTDD